MNFDSKIYSKYKIPRLRRLFYIIFTCNDNKFSELYIKFVLISFLLCKCEHSIWILGIPTFNI